MWSLSFIWFHWKYFQKERYNIRTTNNIGASNAKSYCDVKYIITQLSLSLPSAIILCHFNKGIIMEMDLLELSPSCQESHTVTVLLPNLLVSCKTKKAEKWKLRVLQSILCDGQYLTMDIFLKIQLISFWGYEQNITAIVWIPITLVTHFFFWSIRSLPWQLLSYFDIFWISGWTNLMYLHCLH